METNRESKVVIDKHMRKFGLEAYRPICARGPWQQVFAMKKQNNTQIT
jgi:hypothetical protein